MTKCYRLAFSFFCFILFFQSIPAVSAAPRQLILDVVEVTWPGAKTPDVSRQDVAEAINGEVKRSWKVFTQLDSKGSDSSIEVVLGEVLQERYLLAKSLSCSDNNFQTILNEIRSFTYKKLGISNSERRSLVVLTPPAGCIWLGKASLGDQEKAGLGLVVQNTANPFVITHEVGHLLGLGHSNLLRCANGSSDGPWSNTCRAIEYGGSVDVMGNVQTEGLLSIYHQWRLGLVPAEQIRTSWVSESIELNSLDSINGIRGIFFRDKDAAYWLEYRAASLKQGFKAGLVIYRTDPPPYQFVDTPVQDQAIIGRPGYGLTADIWMLNLDNYIYSQTGQASGSMTLSGTRTFSTYSGNVIISFSPGSSDSKVKVAILRKSDSTPPPTPVLSDQVKWTSPENSVINEGYEDGETAISSFEAQIDGKEAKEIVTQNDGTIATYLDPFNQRKLLRVKDLPEGNYEIKIRTKDYWGNVSQWSNSRKILIDRSRPNVGSAIRIENYDKERVKASLSEFKDLGSGLCQTSIYSNIGFVKQSSEMRENPLFEFGLSENQLGNFETFDCLGNGIMGKFYLSTKYKTMDEVKRTGRWVSVKAGNVLGMRCVGKCTISTSVKDNVTVISGFGKFDVLLSGKQVSKVAESKSVVPRIGANITVGASSKVMRLSGQDFVVYGLVQSRLEISEIEPVFKTLTTIDSSLDDVTQKLLVKFGFREGDFSNSWKISPMERGTTLLDPSLDLCSATYKSETGRQNRRQVIVTRVKSPYLFLSSEVVKYKDATAGLAALKELQANYEDCLKNKGGVESSGNFVDYSFKSIPASGIKLVDENSRVLVRTQIGQGASARQLLAIYQFNGEMFTGLYVVRAGEIGFEDSEVIEWFEVAGVLAQRLESKF